MIRRVFFYLATAVCLSGCAAAGTVPSAGLDGKAMKTITDVIREHSGELMSIPGVVGAAEGLKEGRPCVQVLVIEATPELERKIPKDLGGYPVEIIETGEIRVYPRK